MNALVPIIPEPETDGEDQKFEAKTLSGDMRDAILNIIRGMPDPWHTMSADMQAGTVASVEALARDIIRKAIAIVSAHEFPRAIVKLEEVKVSGPKLVCKLTADNDLENREALTANTMRLCELVITDARDFDGERAPAEIEPDQPDFGFPETYEP